MDTPKLIEFDEEKAKKLKSGVVEYIEIFEDEDFHEDQQSKFEYKIFEAAVELFYGKEVWDYINKLPTHAQRR